MAWSADVGKTWQSLHKANRPRLAADVTAPHLGEDFCTCLGEGATGQIYVGHQQTGIDLFESAPARVAVLTTPLFVKAIVADGITYIGNFGYQTHGVVHPGPGGPIALITASNVPSDTRHPQIVQLANLPHSAATLDPVSLDPVAELQNLKDCYTEGQFQAIIDQCERCQREVKYARWRSQLLYTEWVAYRNLGDASDSDRLKGLFLERYPMEPLAEDMYLEDAIHFFIDGQYERAKSTLDAIEAHFPRSAASQKAAEIRQQTKHQILFP